jgi:AcrR family transcriptional regulator
MAKGATNTTGGATDRPHRLRRLSPDVRRRQIVVEAAQLIAESGFNGVSLSAIAQRCGVAKSLVVHYFPSMKHLLGAVLDYRDERSFAELFGSALPAAEPQAVRAFFTRAVEYNLGQRELVRLHHTLDAEALAADHPAHDYFAGRAVKLRQVTEALLAWKPDPGLAAVQFVAFWDGLERQWLRDPQVDLLAVWSDFCDRFFI